MGQKKDELFKGKNKEKFPISYEIGNFYGARYRTRTCDPMHVKHVL